MTFTKRNRKLVLALIQFRVKFFHMEKKPGKHDEGDDTYANQNAM